MNLDIRMPIGLFFLLVGAVLAVFGATTNADAMYEHSLGLNVNLIWGAVLLVFGAIMVVMARRASKKAPAA